MHRLFIHCLIFLVLVVTVYELSGPNPFEMNSISTFSEQKKPVSEQEQSLKNEIKEKSKQFEESPQDATIDKVWKKMPGRNGLKVNIQKSFEKMKEEGEFDKSSLVFEEIEPEVTLEDLPPSPIYRGHPEKQMVSFIINVSWGTEHIPNMLETLKKHKVKANFFVEGKWARNNTDVVKMIEEEGHIIGNHAYNHPDMKRLSKSEKKEQLAQTDEVLKAITGKSTKWFTPPSGSFESGVVNVAADLNMETVLWSVDTIDWRKPSPNVMINRVMSNIHPGAIILMHPTPAIDNGLDQLIKNIKKEYKIGTIEKLLSEKR